MQMECTLPTILTKPSPWISGTPVLCRRAILLGSLPTGYSTQISTRSLRLIIHNPHIRFTKFYLELDNNLDKSYVAAGNVAADTTVDVPKTLFLQVMDGRMAA